MGEANAQELQKITCIHRQSFSVAFTRSPTAPPRPPQFLLPWQQRQWMLLCYDKYPPHLPFSCSRVCQLEWSGSEQTECWEAVERALPGWGRGTFRLVGRSLVSVRKKEQHLHTSQIQHAIHTTEYVSSLSFRMALNSCPQVIWDDYRQNLVITFTQ